MDDGTSSSTTCHMPHASCQEYLMILLLLWCWSHVTTMIHLVLLLIPVIVERQRTHSDEWWFTGMRRRLSSHHHMLPAKITLWWSQSQITMRQCHTCATYHYKLIVMIQNENKTSTTSSCPPTPTILSGEDSKRSCHGHGWWVVLVLMIPLLLSSFSMISTLIPTYLIQQTHGVPPPTSTVSYHLLK